MAKQVQLKAKSRTETGKGVAKRLRAAGVVPGVVYGAKVQPLAVTVTTDDLQTILEEHGTGGNVLVDLQVEQDGKTANRLALIQDVQQHPFQDRILHVDFREVSATEKLRTAVPVRAIGEPAGVKTGGGVLEFVMRELHVECLPQDLPDVIEVNVEAMEIGQSISVAQVAAPKGVAVLDSKDLAVFIVAAPMAEEEATPAEAVPGEPEVIGAKPAEGEEGAEGEAKPAAGKAEAGKAGAAAAPAAAGAKGAAPAAGAKGAAAAAPAAKPEAKKK